LYGFVIAFYLLACCCRYVRN